MMNLWYLRKSSRSSCPMVISCQEWVHTYCIVALCRWHCVVCPCFTEMNIIEEYERNLQFEEKYISSVVEGLDDAHIICPVCRTSVCFKSALTFNNVLSSLSQLLLASLKGVFHICHVWQEKLEHQQPFNLLPLRSVPEHKGLFTGTKGLFIDLRFHRTIKEKKRYGQNTQLNFTERWTGSIFLQWNSVDKVSRSLDISNERQRQTSKLPSDVQLKNSNNMGKKLYFIWFMWVRLWMWCDCSHVCMSLPMWLLIHRSKGV